MKTGLLSKIYGKEDLKVVLDCASELGYDAIEITSRPNERNIDVDEIISNGGEKILDMVQEKNLFISALTCHLNFFHANKGQFFIEHFKKVIKAAEIMKVPVVTAIAGTPKEGEAIFDHEDEYVAIFRPLVELAEESCVKIAMEPFYPHIAFNKPTIERMFELISSPAFGLNFDPSHYFWQGIDYCNLVEYFAPRIFHTHAKDCVILDDVLKDEGVNGKKWHQFRIPGKGQINWKELLYTYAKIGYDGVLSFEHEDPTADKYDGSRDTLEFLKKVIL